jgi:hypothetical protein
VISSREYYGGYQGQTLPVLPTLVVLNPRFARFWRLRAGAGSMYVRLMDPSVVWTRLRPGVWRLLVWNDGVNAFDVQKHDASVLCIIQPGKVAHIDLASSATSAWASTPADRFWAARLREAL